MIADARLPLRLGRVSLARVRRHEPWFAARYLHERERALCRGLHVDKRRVELVAGRVAAKRALGCDAARATALCVLPATGARAGAPRLFADDGAPLATALSISHGADWAVAVASDEARVGVDVERVEARDPSFAAEAFADGELAGWAAALGGGVEDPRVVTVAWCAKEALLKIEGSGLRAVLPGIAPDAIELRSGAPGELARGTLHARPIGDCQLALAVDDTRAIVIVWSKNGRDEP
jgi:4'-phosphopantetheinyl transferase EntD